MNVSRRKFVATAVLGVAATLSGVGLADMLQPERNLLRVKRYDGALSAEPTEIDWFDMVEGDIIHFGDEPNGVLHQIESLPYICPKSGIEAIKVSRPIVPVVCAA